MKLTNRMETLTAQQQEIIDEYLGTGVVNNKLNKICKKLIRKKDVPQMYEDDLYSLGGEVFMESLCSFDVSNEKECSFESYLTGNIWKSYYDWTRDNTRWKRCNLQVDENGKCMKDDKGNPIILSDISLDASLTEDEEDGTLADIICSDFDIEKELQEEFQPEISKKMECYLDTLGTVQLQIAELIMIGFTSKEIKAKLGIGDKQYIRYIEDMRDYEKSKLLRR